MTFDPEDHDLRDSCAPPPANFIDVRQGGGPGDDGSAENVTVRLRVNLNLRKIAKVVSLLSSAGCVARFIERRVKGAIRSPASRARLALEPPPSGARYDYVIVGGGSAGCVLAARLSEDASATVLLLEAGDDVNHLARVAPALASQPARAIPDADWHFDATLERASGTRETVTLSRGKCLGGTAAVDQLLHVRGDPAAYDDWARREGCEGWSYRDLVPYFKRSESVRGIQDERTGRAGATRGAGGPLPVAPAATERNLHPASADFLDRADVLRRLPDDADDADDDASDDASDDADDDASDDPSDDASDDASDDSSASRVAYNADYNDPVPPSPPRLGRRLAWTDGVAARSDHPRVTLSGVAQVNALDGRRCDPSWAYLTPEVLRRPNLTVAVGARVTRVVFEGNRATGVRHVRGAADPKRRGEGGRRRREGGSAAAAAAAAVGSGPEHSVLANREVLLCAGAVGAPWLLQLSGVGARATLAGVGVPVVADVPGVGADLVAPLATPRYFARAKAGRAGAGEEDRDRPAEPDPRRARGGPPGAPRGADETAPRDESPKPPPPPKKKTSFARSRTRETRAAKRAWRRVRSLPAKLWQTARFVLHFGPARPGDAADAATEKVFERVARGGGALARPPVEALAFGYFHDESDASSDASTVQTMMTFAPSLPPEEEGAARRVASVDDGCTVTVVAPPPPPRRRGRLAIVSADPATPPAIHLGREDESAALAALRLPRRFIGEPFVPFATGAARPTHAVANTCRMGAASDPGAVVDASLRVRGVRGVRVVGAAVAPSALAAGAHSAAPTVAIAERAADIIAKDAAHAETRGGREKKKKAARETDEADEAERADAETQTEDEATRRVVSVSVSRAPEAGFRPRDLESDPASEAASSAASSGVASPDTPRRREASPPPTPPTSPPSGWDLV